MSGPTRPDERRTTVDYVFDALHRRIVSLELKPGDRISEAEIAAHHGVSRQPVRDAFSRLANLDLLKIRPQRATEVRRFSMREIEKARFVRAAVELAVLPRAVAACTADDAERLRDNLARQRAAIADEDHDAFGALDLEFHRTLCETADLGFVFEVIETEKAKVDRLCVLSIAKEARMPQLFEDHEMIAEAVVAGDVERAVALCELHLSRLDATIESIAESNGDYFESDES